MSAKEYREKLSRRIEQAYGIEVARNKKIIKFCLKMFREGFEIEFVIDRLAEQYGLIKISADEQTIT